MIRHIVSWNFKSTLSDEEKALGRRLLLEGMSGLKEKIPCLIALDIVAPTMETSTCQIALYTEFETVEDLNGYQIHPEHLKIVDVVRAYCCDRHCVDISV